MGSCLCEELPEHSGAVNGDMASLKIHLKESRDVAAGTGGFWFEKPEEFQFEAGQFVELTLAGGPGEPHTFSLASAPEEDGLLIATRLRDTEYKRALKKLAPGDEASVEGPYGKLTLPKDASRPIVILTGGIGITPFRSMVVHVVRAGLPHRIFLFYSNRRPEDASFLEELQALADEATHVRFIPTMTAPETSEREWKGETGRIGKELLDRVLGDEVSALYYTAGPPGMVRSMRQMLSDAGITASDIRSESFSGY